jgi:hypothetical protein
MSSSEMLRRVALLRTDVSEGRIITIIELKRISELGATLEVPRNSHTILSQPVSITANVVSSAPFFPP